MAAPSSSDLVNIAEQVVLNSRNGVLTPERIQLGEKLLNDEEALISSFPRCSLGPFLLDQVDSPKLTRLVLDRFYDPELLRAVACVSQAIALAPNHQQIANVNRIHRWFRNLRQLGGASNISGFAMVAGLEGADDKLFIIKAPQDPNDRTTVNELFVGLFGLNALRDSIPNFAIVYTGFKCSLPVFNPGTKEVENWCRRGQQSYYVVYENISPNSTIPEQCRIMTPGQFFPIYLQILLALRAAFLACKFTHWDLHRENVILRNLPSPASIPYQTKYGQRYLVSDKVATIIDYGRCTIQYQDRGYTDLTKPYTQPNPFIIGDAHRFLCNCIEVALVPIEAGGPAPNLPLATALGRILTFFTSLPMASYILNKSLRRQNFQIYPTPRLQAVDIDSLIDHVLQVSSVPLLFEAPTTGRVLSCQMGGSCSRNLEGVLLEVGQVTPPEDIFHLADRLKELEQRRDVGAMQALLNDPRSRQTYERALTEYEALYQKVLAEISGLTIVELRNSRPEALRYELLSTYIYYIGKMMGIDDHIEQLTFEYQVLSAIAPRLSAQAPVEHITELRQRFAPFISYLASDVETAKKLVARPEFKWALREDPRIIWLQNVLPRLIEIVRA